MQHKYLNTFLVIFLFYTITTSLHFTERSQNVPECPQYCHHEGVVSFRDTVGADHVAEWCYQDLANTFAWLIHDVRKKQTLKHRSTQQEAL